MGIKLHIFIYTGHKFCKYDGGVLQGICKVHILQDAGAGGDYLVFDLVDNLINAAVVVIKCLAVYIGGDVYKRQWLHHHS